MRIAVGGIMHESNTFSNVPTSFASFESNSLTVGDEIIGHWRDAHHEVGGFIEGAQKFGFQLYPTLMAVATPSGKVTDEALDKLMEEMVGRLQAAPNLDGMLLALHGAMVAESYPDGDGEVLRRLRDTLGTDFPIVATLDYHANVSEQMAHIATALVIYQTYPHVDQRQRGLKAAEILFRTIRGEVKPTQALSKPPLLINQICQETEREPMKSIMDDARKLEQRSVVLAASVAGGFNYADVYEIGPSVVVVTDDDKETAQREADRLGGKLWELREHLKVELPDAAQAVAMAMQSKEVPVVLVDMGDNVGGGSAGDGTVILSEIMEQGADGAVIVLFAPEAVQECIKVGVRGEVEVVVGGKMDRLHGEPVKVRGRVRCLHDGFYTEPQARHGGQYYHDQGITAVVEIEGPNTLVLTSKKEPPFSLGQLTSLGIQPQRQRILVVKAAIAYKAAYAPIAARIIEVDTPGVTAINPMRFTFHNVRPGLYPLTKSV